MKKKLLKRLGKKVREMRRKKDMTQAELANSLGKDQTSIQRLEKGKINPSIYYLSEIAEGLGSNLSELLKGI